MSSKHYNKTMSQFRTYYSNTFFLWRYQGDTGGPSPVVGRKCYISVHHSFDFITLLKFSILVYGLMLRITDVPCIGTKPTFNICVVGHNNLLNIIYFHCFIIFRIRWFVSEWRSLFVLLFVKENRRDNSIMLFTNEFVFLILKRFCVSTRRKQIEGFNHFWVEKRSW